MSPDTVQRCPRCPQREHRDGARYCRACGAALPGGDSLLRWTWALTMIVGVPFVLLAFRAPTAASRSVLAATGLCAAGGAALFGARLAGAEPMARAVAWVGPPLAVLILLAWSAAGATP